MKVSLSAVCSSADLSSPTRHICVWGRLEANLESFRLGRQRPTSASAVSHLQLTATTRLTPLALAQRSAGGSGLPASSKGGVQNGGRRMASAQRTERG